MGKNKGWQAPTVGLLPDKLDEGVRPAFQKALKTKICDFPYPIYDLTKIWVPYLNPDLIPCFSPVLIRTDVKDIEKGFYSWCCFLRETSIED